MIKQIYEELKMNRELRKNLIALKQELKDEKAREELLSVLRGNYSVLTDLLKDSEPKVRKNAALVLGRLKQAENAALLYEAYERETQLFVKSNYLKALAELNDLPCMPKLRQRLRELETYHPSVEEEKHIREELAALRKLTGKSDSHKRHIFQGYDNTWEVILSTGRKYQHITAEQIRGGEVKILKNGVHLITSHIKPVLMIPTYRELLFPLNIRKISEEPQEAAEMLAGSNLPELLQKAHKTEDDFYFRLELQSSKTLKQRSIFTKKCAFALEQKTNGKLKNSASDYELEIRLLENREGKFLPLVKLYTFEEQRFSYRKHVVASSIRPEQAALIVRLAKPYLSEAAQILDPFCGVGTMLIERDRVCPARRMYGVDIFGEAVVKARENTRLADREIYYINRDFFEFSHKSLFDEIITNMPERGKKSKEELDKLYKLFFEKAGEILKKTGKIILYSNEMNFVKKQLRLHKSFRLCQEYSMDERDIYYLFIIEKTV
ncbi:RNA methyltransferase [Lachnospiraceae bacterium]|nr:RNA methyltransferase [Lachnospiraceae bacterium]